MNFCLDVSRRVSALMQARPSARSTCGAGLLRSSASHGHHLAQADHAWEHVGQEQGLGPREALEAVRLETAAQQPSHAFLAGGDTRVGDFILLVDSDTRVPCDCFSAARLPRCSAPTCSRVRPRSPPRRALHEQLVDSASA